MFQRTYVSTAPTNANETVNRIPRSFASIQTQQNLMVQGRLPCPVIIPQRRPENKSRGWMLDYAPALNDCGIDQTTFLDSLGAFNKASKVGSL
jgi:hypothetical protein